MTRKITKYFICYTNSKGKIENAFVELGEAKNKEELYIQILQSLAQDQKSNDVRLVNVEKLYTYGREDDGDEANRWCH